MAKSVLLLLIWIQQEVNLSWVRQGELIMGEKTHNKGNIPPLTLENSVILRWDEIPKIRQQGRRPLCRQSRSLFLLARQKEDKLYTRLLQN